ncbi:MAG: 3-oxoacyl-[acyl-carrier-protein] synthase III C-terminal domain-containing protein [Limisphaerales bacterium]
MFIVGLGSATPGNRFTQAQCWDALVGSTQFLNLSGRSKAILKKVLLGENGIDTRYLAFDDLNEAFAIDPDTLHRRFAKHAPVVAAGAARRALESAGKKAEEIDALLISTCTGYLCPGLTSYVSEALGLRADAVCLDLVGQGCAAAVPNLGTADAFIARGANTTLSVCVEICSAAFYLDDDPGVLISACLFGDAAGAVVCSDEASGTRPLKWLGWQTSLDPKNRDLLRFEQRRGMLRNVLDKSVPCLVVEQAREVLARGLAVNGLEKSQVANWILHSGGRDVLAALCSGLELSDTDIAHSVEILREHANVSSASVILTLQRALAHDAPRGYWWLSAFGAGISCHGAFLEG